MNKDKVQSELLNKLHFSPLDIDNLSIFHDELLRFNKKYPDGTNRKILDNTLLKKLGWKPKISIYKGLSETIEWYVKSLSNKKIK